MTVLVSVLPDGSVSVTDNGLTHPPLSPEAVVAIAGHMDASANAHKSQALAEGLNALAQLITAAAPIAGSSAYAQVTVTPGQATAVVDEASFLLVRNTMPGKPNEAGDWVSGPVTVSPKAASPTPAP